MGEPGKDERTSSERWSRRALARGRLGRTSSQAGLRSVEGAGLKVRRD
jgi:hypothetical protein